MAKGTLQVWLNLKTLEIILDYQVGPVWSHESLKAERGEEEWVCEMRWKEGGGRGIFNVRRTQPVIAGFEEGERGTPGKEYSSLSKVGIAAHFQQQERRDFGPTASRSGTLPATPVSRKRILPHGLWKETQLARTLIFVQSDWHQTSDLQNYEIAQLGCFKPLRPR